MLTRIQIDKSQKAPIYQQVVDQIIKAIEQGDLKKGDKLLTERSLSSVLHVSRGTINKAYEILKQEKIIVSKMGSHHYVSGLDSQNDQKKKKAMDCTTRYISELSQLGYSHDQILNFVHLLLLEQSNRPDKVKIAVIECRHDALFIFKRQLGHLKHLELFFFLVDEIFHSPQKVEEANSCDLALTTASHYYEVCREAPSMQSKLVEVVTAWAEKTIFDMAAIRSDARIGVVYTNSRTITLVQSALKYFNIKYESFSAFNENNLRAFQEFTDMQTVLIAEPLSVIFRSDRQEELTRDFTRRGGTIICFDHYIDKGSLLIIEQAISRIMEQKKADLKAED